MRKPQSKLETALDPSQQDQLADWLLSGMPYHQARELVSKQFGLAVALSAFSTFWQKVCAPKLIARRHLALTTADEIAADAARTPGQFDAATIDALKQKAFELSISPVANPKDVKSLFSLVLKSRDQDLKQSQIALAERRIDALERQAREAKDKLNAVATKGGLTPETLARIQEAVAIL
jgi:hypothetical protein